MKTVALSILSVLICVGLINGQKISEWRPEHRTGVSAEKGLLKSWPSTGPGMNHILKAGVLLQSKETKYM